MTKDEILALKDSADNDLNFWRAMRHPKMSELCTLALKGLEAERIAALSADFRANEHRHKQEEGRGDAVHDDRWIIARETVVPAMPPDNRTMLGYLVVYAWPSFRTNDEARAFLKERSLPLGWVIMRESQLRQSPPVTSKPEAQTFDVTFSGDTHLLKSFSAGVVEVTPKPVPIGDEDVEMNYAEFKRTFPDFAFTLGEVCELARDGFVAVGVDDAGARRVFTLRIEAAEGVREFPFPARRA